MPLTNAETSDRLKSVPEWKIESGELTRTYTFKNFLSAMDFVNSVAQIAEKGGHHPDIDIRYNKVRLALVTHDAGGLTPKDFEMATELSKIG